MPRVFYDGFESYAVGNLPSTYWEVTNPNTNGQTQVVSSSIDGVAGPYAGTKMARANWLPGNPQFSRFRFVYPANWGGANELFLRMRYRFDQDFIWNPSLSNGPGVHSFRMFEGVNNDFQVAGAPLNNNLIFSFWINGAYEKVINEFPVDPGSLFFFSSSWHLLEVYLKYSATTAMKVWLDGSIYRGGAQASGFTFPVKFPNWDFTSNYGDAIPPPDSVNHLYVDEFEIFSDAAWGLGFDEATTGTMSDASIQVAVAGGTALFLA